MVGGAPGGPYHKLQKQAKTNITTKHTTKSDGHKKTNGRGCPREALPKTTKTIKNKQPTPQNNTTKSDGKQRGIAGVPQGGALPKPTKTINTSKNNQNHQDHQTPSNLMEINGGCRRCPRGALPKTTKHNQNTTKTTTTIKSDGNQRKW